MILPYSLGRWALRLLLVVTLAMGSARAQNLFPNGSVEEGSGSAPDAFYRDPTVGDYALWDTAQAWDGSRSLRLRSGSAGEAHWFSEAFPVEAGMSYRFITRVRQENVNTAPQDDDHRWAVIIRFGTDRGADGHLQGILSPDHYLWFDQSVATQDWYTVTAEFIAPAGAAYVDWNLRKRSAAAGRVWADGMVCEAAADEMTTGEAAAFGIEDGISLLAAYTGDADEDGGANLDYRPGSGGDWTGAGPMARGIGYFSSEIHGLQAAQAYDLRVTFNDPDGVSGENPRMLTGVVAGESGAVELVEATDSGFVVRTGGYTVEYDSAATNGLVILQGAGGGGAALATPLLVGSDLSPTDPSRLASLAVVEEDDAIRVTFLSTPDWGTVTGVLVFPISRPGLVHWEVRVEPGSSYTVSTVGYPLRFYDRDTGEYETGSTTYYADQYPYAAPAVFLLETGHIGGTAFYFEDLTPANPYFERIGVPPAESVGGHTGGFGYHIPVGDVPLETGVEITLTSAYLLLTPGVPDGETGMAARYLEGMAAVWPYIVKPQFDPPDWDSIGAQAIFDIRHNAANWVTVLGRPMLRAYVGDPRTGSAEAISQLDVLVSLRQYMQSHTDSEADGLDASLTPLLTRFFNLEYQTFVNDFPNSGIGRGDSWYTVQLHLDLARLAALGDTDARDLLYASIDAVIDLAHNADYRFPVFFNYEGNQPTSGSEPDVAGAYALLMMMCRDLYGEARFQDEAVEAVEALRGHGLDLLYEAHITAAAAAGCARLFERTGNSEYLELSYLPLASFVRALWLWECDYGYASEYVTFCGVSAMARISYIAAKEQHEAWRYLNEYLELTDGSLDPALETFLEGVVQYAGLPVRSALPPFLPPDAVADGQWGVNDPSLYIPLEDLKDGFRQSGQVGQELYGAGAPITFAAGYVSGAPERGDAGGALPGKPAFGAVYPNPANPGLRLLVMVPESYAGEPVTVDVVNLLGRRVVRLHEGPLEAGGNRLSWNGFTSGGAPAASGVYILRLRAGGEEERRRVVLLR